MKDLLSKITDIELCRNKTSPFTGGKMALVTREETFNFRGEEITIGAKSYLCLDTGKGFTDDGLDDDAMWQIVRKYWEGKGVSPCNLVVKDDKK